MEIRNALLLENCVVAHPVVSGLEALDLMEAPSTSRNFGIPLICSNTSTSMRMLMHTTLRPEQWQECQQLALSRSESV